jgi:hypothetical protein
MRVTYQALEVLHEHLQTHIISEDRLSGTASLIGAIHPSRHVCRRWIELGEKEAGLATTLVANDVPRDRETIC